jgi:NADH/F420H2 dehydrogenase subunit C
MHRRYPFNNSFFCLQAVSKEANQIYTKDLVQLRFLLYLQGTLNKFLIQVSVSVDTYIVHINAQHILPFLFFIRSNSLCRFGILTDLVAMDTLAGFKRFFICYNLLSLNNNIRMLVKVRLSDTDEISSVTPLYINANWAEREAWDLFGIHFSNHPDLRRILTDYGFEAHPLRKDFPLTGYKEINYSESRKMIRGAPVSLSQEYRVFLFNNPWRAENDKMIDAVVN